MLEITKISNGEKAEELSNKIINLINEYSETLTGFEVVGVLDTVKQETHRSLQEDED